MRNYALRACGIPLTLSGGARWAELHTIFISVCGRQCVKTTMGSVWHPGLWRCRRACATMRDTRSICPRWRVKTASSAAFWVKKRRKTAAGTRSTSRFTRIFSSTLRTSRAPGLLGFICWRDAPARGFQLQRCQPLERRLRINSRCVSDLSLAVEDTCWIKCQIYDVNVSVWNRGGENHVFAFVYERVCPFKRSGAVYWGYWDFLPQWIISQGRFVLWKSVSV